MEAFNPQSKLLHYPQHLLAFLEGKWEMPPINVEISPTNKCTASCPWCFYHTKHTDEELDQKQLHFLLTDLHRMGVKAITWTGGGDPSVYTHINTSIAFAYSLGLKQGLFTNAYIPISNPELLDWIRVTVTDRYVITKYVSEYAKATRVGVNFNVTPENSNRVVGMAIAAREAGVDYFQVRPALGQGEVKCPDLSDLETEHFKIEYTPYKWQDYLLPHGYPICHGHRFVPFIWHNGDVAVCAYHFGDPSFIFGNLYQTRFRELWRNRLRCPVNVIPSCQRCCKLHEINKRLAALNNEIPLPIDGAFV